MIRSTVDLRGSSRLTQKGKAALGQAFTHDALSVERVHPFSGGEIRYFGQGRFGLYGADLPNSDDAWIRIQENVLDMGNVWNSCAGSWGIEAALKFPISPKRSE